MWLTSAPSSQWSKLSVGWNCCCLSWAVVFAISIAAIKLLERKIHIYSFILFLEKTPTYLSVVLKVADCLAWACYNLSIVTVVNFTIWTSASEFSLSGRISAWASCPILTFKYLQSQDFNITNVVIPIVVPLLDTCRLGLYLILKFIVISNTWIKEGRWKIPFFCDYYHSFPQFLSNIFLVRSCQMQTTIQKLQIRLPPSFLVENVIKTVNFP